MFYFEILIREGTTIYRLSTLSITTNNITSLNHEPWNYTMEGCVLVMQRFSSGTLALLPCFQKEDIMIRKQLSDKADRTQKTVT